jgi:hypothetical protein
MVRHIKFQITPSTQTANLLIGDTIEECNIWVAKKHPGYSAYQHKYPCAITVNGYYHYVLLDKNGFRPGLLAHELSHMVTRLMGDEMRSSLLDSFMDKAFIQLRKHGYPLVFKHSDKYETAPGPNRVASSLRRRRKRRA